MVHNHGDRKSLRPVVTPLSNGRTSWLTSMGVILTTYDTWDDPPQVDLSVSSWSYHSPGKSTETCCTPQKSNELIPRIAMFTGSYLFQPSILSIHVSFRGCICIMNPFSTSHTTIKNKSMMRVDYGSLAFM